MALQKYKILQLVNVLMPMEDAVRYAQITMVLLPVHVQLEY